MNTGALVLMLSGAFTGALLGSIGGEPFTELGAIFGAVVGYFAWALCSVSASADERARRLHE